MDLFTMQKRIVSLWLQNIFHCRSSSTERWYSIEQQQWSMESWEKAQETRRNFLLSRPAGCIGYGRHRTCTDKEIEWEIQASQISSCQPSFYCCYAHTAYTLMNRSTRLKWKRQQQFQPEIIYYMDAIIKYPLINTNYTHHGITTNGNKWVCTAATDSRKHHRSSEYVRAYDELENVSGFGCVCCVCFTEG